MSIYQSSKVMPYVYRLTHKVTNQFYIGYRQANKEVPEIDILKYQTSSKYVKELGFENFNFEILALFFDGQDAYDYEQCIIQENFDDPLIINRQYVRSGNQRFRTTGPQSPEHKTKRLSAITGKKRRPDTMVKATKAARLKVKGKKQSTEHVEKRINVRKASYQVTWEDGSTESFTGLYSFCRENGLNPSCMNDVIKGKSRQHRRVVSCVKINPYAIFRL